MEYAEDTLLNIYEKLVLIRYCEESFVDPILNGEIIGPVHLYSGEEAVAVGVCAALKKSDVVFGTHRSHGHFIAKGGSVRKLVSEVYCRDSGCSKGRGGSQHLIDVSAGMLGATPIVGGTISLALGAALAASLRKDKSVAVAFFGDGASGEGVLWECVNFASVKKLPIIFVCENNLYSTHMSIDEIRANRNVYETAKSFDIFSKQIDGNNVLDVFETAKLAVDLCRNSEGPCFIEAKTYRLRGHVGPDDNIQGTHTDIRPEAELESWKKRDPVKLFEEYLLTAGIGREALDEIKNRAGLEVKAAVESLRETQKPAGKEELLKYVFR
ncbi:MAG: thiamine pyrophosphate-dependent dehydrogenase E1 component subunit alpha [Victivallaceae bacterium]|nr:thiamine pyrophosphate-dependent dehydrogenase E1 component subunit alpha [Victivallaceae bacterium]